MVHFSLSLLFRLCRCLSLLGQMIVGWVFLNAFVLHAKMHIDRQKDLQEEQGGYAIAELAVQGLVVPDTHAAPCS